MERTNGDEKYDLNSILCAPNRDFLIRSNGDQVKVDILKRKVVGLYFSASWCGPCQRFTPKLGDAYNELKQLGKFEVVFVSGDRETEKFDEYFTKMPWFAIPFTDCETRERLNEMFSVQGIPHLVFLDSNGKVLTDEGVEIIQEYGKKAYPFTPEKFAELEEIEKAKQEAQTLESILVSNDCDFVIGKNGAKLPISNLVGKNILLYFSAHWCPPCRAFLPKLIQAYQKIHTKYNSLEVIFISSDKDQASFNEFFSTMPWLAIPFGDSRKESLSKLFKVKGIPMVVAIGKNGKTVTTEAQDLIMCHGAEAYPFTAERVKEIEAETDEMAEMWPEKIKHELHEHELELVKRMFYNCDGCDEEGRFWSYYCKDCDFDLHPKCGLDDDDDDDKVTKDGDGEKKSGEGWICDGDKCYRE